MKKSLWMILMLLMTTTLWAVGTGDGKSQPNAIEFDWQTGVTIPRIKEPVWYRIDLNSVSVYEQPNLVLRLKNPHATDSMHVDISLFYEKSEEKRAYTIAPNSTKIWSASISILKTMGITEVYLKIKADQKSEIDAKVDEREDVNDACLSATAFNGTATVNANTERWYSMDLSDVDQNKIYVLTYTNAGSSSAEITRQLSPSCPVSSPTVRTMTIAAGQSVKDTISRAMLSLLGTNPYLGVTGTQKITIAGAKADAAILPVWVDCAYQSTRPGEWEELVAGAGAENYFRVDRDSLLKLRHQPQISFSNDSNDVDATVRVDFIINGNCQSREYTTHIVTIPAKETGTLDISRDMVMAIDNSVQYIYVRIATNQPNMQAMWRMKHLHEGDRCKYATTINWAETQYQDGNTEIWYAMDISEAKEKKLDVTATITNRESTAANVTGWLVFKCPYNDWQEMSHKLQAGEVYTKTIPYSSFSSIAGDIVWLGLKSNNAIAIRLDSTAAERLDEEESRACTEAIRFDWNNGHVQAAADTVWYEIGVDTLRKAVAQGMIPYKLLSNRSNVSGTFKTATTYECPATTAYSEQTQSIAAFSSYEELISVDMINNLSPDVNTLYMRLIGTQDFSFQIKMQKPNEGSNCANPILFNWVTGNDYTAEDPVWYLIDLTKAKETDKDMVIRMQNRSQASGTIHGELATVCPCSTTDKKSISIQAGATRIDTIPHAMLETFGDSLWLKVTANVNLHIDVDTITPAPFDTIRVCDKALAVEYGTNYLIEDTTWFYVLTDTVSKTPLVPLVTLTNDGLTAQNIKAEIAYHCPITATMMEQVTTLKAGAQKTKILERATAESMAAQHDTIWIRLTGSKHENFRFRVDLIDPNDGHDCAHAIYVEPDTYVVPEAGKNTWYYMNRETLVENNQYLQLIHHNMTATDGMANLMVYNDCESEILAYHPITLGASAVISDTLAPIAFSSSNAQYIYLKLFASQRDSIELKVLDAEPISPCDTIYDRATEIVPNTIYNLAANTQQWYQLNINNLRNNYESEGEIVFINNNEDDMLVRAAMTWDTIACYQMVETGIKVAGEDESVIQSIAMSDLAKLEHDMLYFRLNPEMDMSFKLEMELTMGEDCADGILFDWKNGNVHPGDTALWYKVELDTTQIGKHDLRLHIDNLSTDTVTATCAIYTDCLEKIPMAKVSYTFAPDSGKYKDIDRDLIIYSGQNQGTWSIYYTSTNTTRIRVELIPEAADSFLLDTVRAFVCDLDEYIDTVKSTVHIIDASVRASLIWNDTVQFRDGTYMIDSITTFIITPIVDPDTFKFNTPELLNALPICRNGMKIFTDSASATLMRYYASRTRTELGDSISPIDSIYWEIKRTDTKGTNIREIYPDRLKDEESVNNVRCVIVVGGLCSGRTIRSNTYTLPVEPRRVDSLVITDTVCVGEEYPQYNGYTIKVESDITDIVTRPNAFVPDTLGLLREIDSLYIYHLTTWKMPLVKEISTLNPTSLPTAKIGESIKAARMMNELNTYYVDEEYAHYPIKDTVGVTEIIWMQQINNGEFKLYDKTYTLACGDTLITLRYGIVTDVCNDTIWSNDYTFYSEHSLTEADPAWEVQDTICHNDTLQLPFSKNIYTEPGIYNDTIVNENGCDTIVAHVLTRLMLYVPSFEEDSAYVVCGQPVHVETITAAVEDSIANNNLLAARYQSMTWEIQKGNEAWTELGTDELDARYDAINLRLTLHTECGDTAYEFSRDLEPASAENVKEFNTLPAESMFGDRILMVNLKEIMEMLDGDTVLAEEVNWYRIMGEQDHIKFDNDDKPYLSPADGDIPDSFVQTGYYYTLPEAEQLSGSYYALVARQFQIDPVEGTCGYAMRTVIIETQSPGQAPVRRKVVEQGNVVIITEDEDRFDTNGRKL